MSLILEALRKSEAERRRGQAPDLRTELPPVAPPRAHALPRWSWALFAAALLALAWLLLARPGAEPAQDSLPAPAATTVPGGSVDPGGRADRAAGPAGADRAMAATRRDTAPGRPGARVVIEPDAGAAPPASTARSEPAPPAPAPALDAAAAGRPATPAGAGVTAAPSTPSPTLPAPPPAPAPATAVATMPTTPAAAPGARLLALSELSSEERRQLPPLKLSMHMWSEDPARRFVILDGQRLAEGDRAGPAVVDAIRSDDVVLAWNGMRLRLSLR